MKRNTIHFRSNSILGIICIAFISLFATSLSTAQNHLIPGQWGSSDEYELALKRVFSEAYVPEVRLRVQIRSKYGIENVTGIRNDSAGYYLFHILPEESIWYSSWVEVPCKDSDGDSLPENSGRTCERLNFSSVDTIKVNNFQTAIDSTLAQKLISLWGEMLIRSSYKQVSNTISTGGTTYQYSTFNFGLGNIQGYSRNPQEYTLTGEFAAISRLMRNAAKAQPSVNTDSLLSHISSRADILMGELLGYGDTAPMRTRSNKILSGCTTEYREMVDSKYCWQAYLADDEIPNLIIANNENGGYAFELVDISDSTDIKKIHLLPVMSINSPFTRDGEFSGWHNYVLEPWDISDLITNTRNKDIQVFGYREFTLENKQVDYGPETVIIRFDGLFSNRDKRVRLDIDGDHGWFSITSLFEND